MWVLGKLKFPQLLQLGAYYPIIARPTSPTPRPLATTRNALRSCRALVNNDGDVFVTRSEDLLL
jgi:hypothetical protein